MKKKKFLLLSLTLSLLLLFVSCKGDAKITLKENGSVSFSFSGFLGDAFQEMMSGAGGDLSSVDEKGIAQALKESGFENINVDVDAKNNLININFEDKQRDSYLFTENIVQVKGDSLDLSLTAQQFVRLYELSGDDIISLLDLFISPVLNDEEMSEEEYIETVEVTYGGDVGKELRESNVNFVITDKKGKTKSKSVYATSIFCGVPLKL